MVLGALFVTAIGVALVAWPAPEVVEYDGSYTMITKRFQLPPVTTFAAVVWSPEQVTGAVLALLGSATLTHVAGTRSRARGGWALLGLGLGVVLVGAVVILAAPPVTSVAELTGGRVLPEQSSAVGWSRGQVTGLVLGSAGLLFSAFGLGAARVRVGARRV